ncbi:MAG: nuclear transport factor 2 family protein [Alphaproteobacteria bacterium]|nr:MAG: nuclear transport factor 2 family protein [Alphaproteobacteria bacterium]
MDNMAQAVAELVDRQQIYHVLTSYCRALDRCDVELMKSVYWEDGFDDHGVFAGNAREFAEFIISGIQEWFEVTQHSISNVHMEFEADRTVAHTESYLFAYHKVKGTAEKVRGWFGEAYLKAHEESVRAGEDQDFLYGGRYFDRFEKRDGVWRIARRTVIMDWNINQPSSALFKDGMFKTLNIRGTRGRADPIYQR